MSDKKRKVITGKERKPDPRRQALESFREKTQKSVGDTQQDMIDENSVESESLSPLDSYVTTKNETLPNGDRKITATPPKVGNVIVDDQVTSSHDMKPKFKHEAINHEPDMTPDAPTAYDKRAEDMSRLLNDFKSARQREGIAAQRAGIQAGVHALNNPAAAQLYFQGSMNRAKSETDGITQGLENQYQYAKNEQQTISNAAQDDLDNPASEVSKQGRKVLFEQFGMQVPDSVSMRAINTVFPMLKTDVQRDTTERGQNFTFKTNEENRKSRESEGAKKRASTEGIAAENRKAGIGKVIIGGALAQDAATRKGASDSAQKLANSATLPDSFSGKTFLVTKKGVPPSPQRAKEIQTLGIEAARYVSVLKQLENLITQAQGRPQFFDENWPTVKAKYAEASQRNVKFNGNGVTNGPDLEQALKQIGDPTSAINWLRGAGKQIIQNASKSAMDQYYVGADAAGFEKSNKPSEITQSIGTGGSQSSQKPVNPALASGANEAAGKFGFGPVVAPSAPSQPQGTPVVVTLKDGTKVNAIRMPDGKIVRQ